MNLLVFEKISYKMSKNWTFQKIIGLGVNFTYEFEVCSKQDVSCKEASTEVRRIESNDRGLGSLR